METFLTDSNCVRSIASLSYLLELHSSMYNITKFVAAFFPPQFRLHAAYLFLEIPPVRGTVVRRVVRRYVEAKT